MVSPRAASSRWGKQGRKARAQDGSAPPGSTGEQLWEGRLCQVRPGPVPLVSLALVRLVSWETPGPGRTVTLGHGC